jgi:hypothetical protein
MNPKSPNRKAIVLVSFMLALPVCGAQSPRALATTNPVPLTATAEKSGEGAGKALPPEMNAFIRFRAVDSGMPYNLVKERIKKDQLPLLYRLLDDEEYAPYWHNIARIIGYISDDTNSVPVLLQYFQRDDGSKVESIAGKIWSIALIGKIGGATADAVLRKALTREGIEELAKSWINEEKWSKGRAPLGKDFAIRYTRNAAIQGLVYTGKPENWKLVEKLYNEQKEISTKEQKQTDMMAPLVDAMATKAFIADNNNEVEAYFRLDRQAGVGPLRPYLDKYSLRSNRQQ